MIENTQGGSAASPGTPDANPQPLPAAPPPGAPDIAKPNVADPSPDKVGQPGDNQPQKT